jgi:hypothetical protein
LNLKLYEIVINEEKDNSKAIHCKIVCEIQLGLFEEAVNHINECHQSLGYFQNWFQSTIN